MLEVNLYITNLPNFGDDRPVTGYRGHPRRACPVLSVAFFKTSHKRLGTARRGLDSNRSVWGEHIVQSCASVQTPMCLSSRFHVFSSSREVSVNRSATSVPLDRAFRFEATRSGFTPAMRI